MSRARQYLPGSTYTYTRRTCLGTCRLVPVAATNALVYFAMAVAAVLTGVSIHAFVAMPNRIRMVVTDNEKRARMPDFLRIFHSLLALALIRRQEEPGPVWDSRGTDLKRIAGRNTIRDTIVDVLSEPVAAGLCWRPEEWYGAKSLVEDMGAGPRSRSRPRRFAAEGTSLERHCDLTLTIPRAFGDISAEDYRALLREGLVARTAELHERRRRAGGQVLSRRQVQERDIFARPAEDRWTAPEDAAARPMARRLECDEALRAELVESLRGFRRAYREAYERWRRGDHDVEFPRGTWAVRQYHGARVPDPA